MVSNRTGSRLRGCEFRRRHTALSSSFRFLNASEFPALIGERMSRSNTAGWQYGSRWRNLSNESRSLSEFCISVPVTHHLRAALRSLAALNCFVCEFLIQCAGAIISRQTDLASGSGGTYLRRARHETMQLFGVSSGLWGSSHS